MKIISIANQKGGCGKTTTAINLASALGINGKRVLLIDLDPQAHASLGLDIESQDSIYNVISNLTPRKLRVEDIIKRVEDKFDIVPSNILVGTLEQELSDEIGRELKLTEIIEPLKSKYDYILIDCPPSLGILTINSIRASHELIIPVETSRFSMQGVDHLTDIVNLVKDRLNHSVQCKILVTMFDSRLRHSFAMMSTFKERFQAILYDTIVHINVKLKESAVMGKPVAFYDKYCRGSKDYNTLAKEIIQKHEQALRMGDEEEAPQEAPQEAPAEPAPAPEPESAPEQPQQKVEEEEEVEVVEFSKRKLDFTEIEEEIKQEAEETQEQEEAVEQTQAAETPQEEPQFQPLSAKMQEVFKKEAKDFFLTKFVIDAPGASSVYVTGSFNDWSLDDTCRLKEAENGQWETNIPLKPGIYKYQFIVDGVWKEDPGNPQKERNSFGDINSLIEVSGDAQAQV